jgi:hypothetical protein
MIGTPLSGLRAERLIQVKAGGAGERDVRAWGVEDR